MHIDSSDSSEVRHVIQRLIKENVPDDEVLGSLSWTMLRSQNAVSVCVSDMDSELVPPPCVHQRYIQAPPVATPSNLSLP